MSVQAALQFIKRVRAEDELQEQIKALGPAPALADLVPIGAGAGLAFTVEELRRAHKHDWAMRWAHYSMKDSP